MARKNHPDARPLEVTVVSEPAALGQWRAAWEELEKQALEESPFLQPAVLMAAWSNLQDEENLCCVLITSGGDSSASNDPKNKKIHGLFPLSRINRRSLRRGIWSHEYCFNATPLIHTEKPRNTIEAFLQWIDRNDTAFFRLPELRADGPFYLALQQVVAQQKRPLFVQKNHFRAAFNPASSVEEFLATRMSKSTRKELLRLERRLAERGNLLCEPLEATGDIEQWIDDFLRLEQSGWKGDKNSALASSTNSRKFFTGMVRELFENQRLVMLKLSLDGEPIAMNTVIKAGESAAYFKIGHAEEFRRYSPGRLLELNFIRWLHQQSDIVYVDSCAEPNHQMIESIWADRQFMQSLWIGSTHWSSYLSLFALSCMHFAKSAWRHRGVARA